MQGAQSGANGMRGIGRYTLAFAKALVTHREDHEIILALNSTASASIDRIRSEFGKMGFANFYEWSPVPGCSSCDPAGGGRRRVSEIVREAAFASLAPDLILVTSLFEGFSEDLVTSVKSYTETKTAVVLYDLIPHLRPELYLTNAAVKQAYYEKIVELKRADLVLTISESARQEALSLHDFAPDSVVNISAALTGPFAPLDLEPHSAHSLKRQHGIAGDFILCTGGIDQRKNLVGLLRAFGLISPDARRGHQLVVVCSISAQEEENAKAIVKSAGLAESDVVFTGFVTDDHLVALYNLCAFAVFPSLHEGFGLPVLEAMACGKAVIAADNSSMPEVVGRKDALFDALDPMSISNKMEEVLLNIAFRNDLARHGVIQAKKFSWDRTAEIALTAGKKLTRTSAPVISKKRPKLAYVSPLPPAKSGIADYSASLIPALMSHYDIDVVTDQSVISDRWIKQNCTIITGHELEQKSADYERVLYHFGNSEFHLNMYSLLKAVPGVVVLHDFFLSGLISHADHTGVSPGLWRRELLNSHGVAALRDLNERGDDVVWKYPCSRFVLQHALGVIVHSEHAVRLAKSWYLAEGQSVIRHVPLPRAEFVASDKLRTRRRLGIKDDEFLFCSFGMIGATKLSDKLLDAWEASALYRGGRSRLVLVGELGSDPFSAKLAKRAEALSGVTLTGWVDSDAYRDWLAAADAAVQLRSKSRGETSAAVLDCFAAGVPTIVNANGSFADLPDCCVEKLADDFGIGDLSASLLKLAKDAGLRSKLAENAKEQVLTRHNLKRCAQEYESAIEAFQFNRGSKLGSFADAVARAGPITPRELELISEAAQTIRFDAACNTLYVDVSLIAENDVGTGIQRVVRSIVRSLPEFLPNSMRVETVGVNVEGEIISRSDFQFAVCNAGPPPDDVGVRVTLRRGDIFLGLDLNPQAISANRALVQSLQRRGVMVAIAVYDLLPITMPKHFFPGAKDSFEEWLRVVAEADVAICISQSTAMELEAWVKANRPDRFERLRIDWFHLGAEAEPSVDGALAPPGGDDFLQVEARTSFLMVGTIEPRKGHAQALAAFELLWSVGIDVNLVIVGKQGWMMEGFCDGLRRHVEYGRRLWLVENVSDAFLGNIYRSCHALLAASEGEGFGLPLIEAAKCGTPIIARDIAVFREVAGEGAYYFSGSSAIELASALKGWLMKYREGAHPRSISIKALTWKESAKQLLSRLDLAASPVDAYANRSGSSLIRGSVVSGKEGGSP